MFLTNIYMLFTLQVWGFQHFNEIRAKDYWVRDREDHHPHAMMYVSLNGQSVTNPKRSHLDNLDLGSVFMNLYHPHRETCLFE